MARTNRVAVFLFVALFGAAGLQAEEAIDARFRDDLALLEQAYAGRTTAAAAEWRQRLTAREGELAATLDALIAGDRGDHALRFVLPYAWFLSTTNREKEAYQALRRALELPSARAATRTRADALHQAGRFAFRRRDQATSRAVNEESLRIARDLNEHASAANALIGLARVALRDHDFAAVTAYAQEAADIRGRIGDAPGRVSAMHMIAAAARMSGDDVRAQELYEMTLASYRATGDRRAAAGEIYNLGYVHLHQNRIDRARELFGQALDEYRTLRNEAGIAYCLTGFAAVAAARHRPDRSALLHGAASAILERLGISLDPDDQMEWDRYTRLARSEAGEQRHAQAYDDGRELSMDAAIVLALADV